MSKQPKPTTPEARHGRALAGYIIGFILSIIVTLTAYTLTVSHHLVGWSLGYSILLLAIIQLIVQLVFFLHIGQEREPRWKLLVFDFTVLVLIIVIIGSLWIMNHLDYHMMTPGDTNTYMRDHEGL